MNPIHQIKSIMNVESIPKGGMLALQPGQMVYGKAEKLLPGQKAVIQVGSRRVIADLKTTLPTGKGCWFEVAANPDGGIELKMATANGEEGMSQSPLSLLEDLHLPVSQYNVRLLEYFLAANLPFSKEQLIKGAGWIKNQDDPAKALTALEFMVEKGLPFTIRTFQAMLAVQEPASLSSQLKELSGFLENDKFALLNTVPPLKQLLASLLADPSMDLFGTGEKIKGMIKSRIQSLGLEFEKEVTKDDKNFFKGLKPLLLAAMDELGADGKRLEPVVNRLTGMQLVSQDISAPVEQMMMQFPLSFGGQNTDVTIHWSGRKTGDGQIDPDYCRIVFYLELKSLSLTAIDMQVQNRVVHLLITNDSMNIEPFVKALTPMLREKLESLGYKLSFINIMPSEQDAGSEVPGTNPSQLLNRTYKGVDIKI